MCSISGPVLRPQVNWDRLVVVAEVNKIYSDFFLSTKYILISFDNIINIIYIYKEQFYSLLREPRRQTHQKVMLYKSDTCLRKTKHILSPSFDGVDA